MKKTKILVSCFLLVGMCFIYSCHRTDFFYVSNCPVEEIRTMEVVDLVVEQCVIKKEDDLNDVFYPNARLTQTKQQMIQIIENPKNWQPDMKFSHENILTWQKTIAESDKSLDNFDCVFSLRKKFTFIDKDGNKKWICFVNARFFDD